MRLIAFFVVAVAVLAVAGCDGTFGTGVQAEQTGTIVGNFSIDPDMPGWSAQSQVNLYASRDDMLLRRPLRSVMTDANGNYTFAEVCCGTYHVGAWKDNDGNGIVSSGDYLSERSSPEDCKCCVRAGNVAVVCGSMTVVP